MTDTPDPTEPATQIGLPPQGPGMPPGPAAPGRPPAAPQAPGYHPPQPGYPPQQPGYPQPGGAPGYPQPGYPPQQPAYPQPGYPPPQPGYPQPGYPPQPPAGAPGYPQPGGAPGYPQQPGGHAMPGGFPGPATAPKRSGLKVVLVLGIVVVLALVAGVIVLGALGDDSSTGVASGPGTPSASGSGSSRSRADRMSTSRSDDQVVRDAVKEVEAYWTSNYPTVYGTAYKPLQGGLFPYGPKTEVPPCPGVRSYQDVAVNAFYCPPADLVAWDTPGLVSPFRKKFGELTVGLIVAHELGHAVQARARMDGRTVTLEQQADCFAGAWVRNVRDGGSATFKASDTDLDNALAGMLLIRDRPGTSAAAPGAHGSAFDRVTAFKDGFENGPKACAGYTDRSIAARLVSLPFADARDAATGGNLPQAEIADLAVTDLEAYWSSVFTRSRKTWKPVADAIAYDPRRSPPACGGKRAPTDDYVEASFYCQADDLVAWDDVNLAPTLYEQGGDYSVATMIGVQYAKAVQARLGVTASAQARQLHADCMTGTWAASLFDGERNTLSLSPGDLDEAIVAMLNVGEAPASLDSTAGGGATGFQRVTAYQQGFVGDLPACAAIVSG